MTKTRRSRASHRRAPSSEGRKEGLAAGIVAMIAFLALALAILALVWLLLPCEWVLPEVMAFERMAAEQVQAVIVQPLFTLAPSMASRVVEVAKRHSLPVASDYAEFPRAGGLFSYGPRREDAIRLMARYVKQILSGARPGDLPVIQPATFLLVTDTWRVALTESGQALARQLARPLIKIVETPLAPPKASLRWRPGLGAPPR